MKILLASILIILAFQISFGQDFQEDENWLGEMGYPMPYLRHIFDYKVYSKEDIIKAKRKLSLIQKTDSNDEWEGYYQKWGELSQIGLIWQKESGFVQYEVYTCAIELRGLGYGEIAQNAESVILNYEKPIIYIYSKKNTSPTQINLVKVKIGEKHFLVPENRLKEFCEYVVGLRKYYENDIQSGYWWKVVELEKDSKELPVLPEKYKHILKHPIEGKIIGVGKRVEQKYKNDNGIVQSNGVNYFVKLNIGKKENVKKDMEFYVPELKDTIMIEKVYSTSSTAILFREFDDNKKEICKDENYKEIPCSQISVGMSVTTKKDSF